MSVEAFYDRLAPFYHLIFQDWEASIARQAEQLRSLIVECCGPEAHTVLDAACGIGTQSLGLAGLGYRVTASDLSAGAVARAAREARRRGLEIRFAQADMRRLAELHPEPFDVVIACDNAVPHLPTDAEILEALRALRRCTRPGGCCILSVRDYDAEPLAGPELRPYGVRLEAGKRYIVFQLWEPEGRSYEMSFYLIEDAGGDDCTTHVMRSRYYAVGTATLAALMEQAGFHDVRRRDGRFFQPVLVGKA